MDNRTGLVSPAGDNGGGVVQASADGNRVTYVALGSFAGGTSAPIGSQYASWLGADAWLTQNINTPTGNQTYVLGTRGAPYEAFAADLSSALELNGTGGGGTEHPVEAPPLAGAPAGYQNFYLNGIHYPGQLSVSPLLSAAPSQPALNFVLELDGATPDLTHVVVSSAAKLAAGAVEVEGEESLYEWESSTRQFQPLNILPDGTPDPAGTVLLGGSHGATDHAISKDGSRVVWSTPGKEGTGLYVREGIGTSSPRTVQADLSQGGPEPGGGGVYLTSSTTSGPGSRIFFLDHERLTPESTAGNTGDLYEFEPDNGPLGKLTDLTVEREGGGSAEVRGVLGASDDGSSVYFVATGALAPGASQGAYNLYLWHEGDPIRFIAALAPGDNAQTGNEAVGVAFDWESELGLRTTRVSPDGTHLLFMSEAPLTGYDNTARNGTSCGWNGQELPLPARCQEVFLYDATSNHLTCVSCDPTSARPTGPSGIPGGTEFRVNRAIYDSRALSEDGSRVFFNSDDALVPQDTNDETDVYEYENGHAYLLSSGTSPESASFVDASANGNDVFFTTRAQLVGQDTDQLTDLYDARAPHVPGERVDFPAPSQAVPCEGDGCRAPASGESGYVSPSSLLFSGAGNVSSAPTPAVKPKAKKHKPKPKPKRHRKKRAKHARRANARRGLRTRAGASVGSARGRA